MSLSAFGGRSMTSRRKPVKKPPAPKGWIGVDLDGTLAVYDRWQSLYHIGEPVPRMLAIVKQMIHDGYRVKIFTARVYDLRDEKRNTFDKVFNAWSMKHIGKVLEVTCVKDFDMIELWDDRAVAVEKNTGKAVRWKDGDVQWI